MGADIEGTTTEIVASMAGLTSIIRETKQGTCQVDLCGARLFTSVLLVALGADIDHRKRSLVVRGMALGANVESRKCTSVHKSTLENSHE